VPTSKRKGEGKGRMGKGEGKGAGWGKRGWGGEGPPVFILQIGHCP